MADRIKTERLIRALHAARVAGQLDELCALFAPGAHFRIAGSSAGKPIAISVVGVAEIRSCLSIMVRTFRLTNYELLSMVIEAPEAAVHWRTHIHSKITGTAVPTELVDLVQVSEAGIASYTELFVPY
ncbi:MAG: nuclear transport factor 2 family protein [Steroidobacteraceae bacterium]|jgi:ketosteroid isomerase-like protein